MKGSHLEAGDGLGNWDKLARVVGEHLSDLEGSDKNLPDKSSFRSEHLEKLSLAYLEGLRQEPLDLPRPGDLDLVLKL